MTADAQAVVVSSVEKLKSRYSPDAWGSVTIQVQAKRGTDHRRVTAFMYRLAMHLEEAAIDAPSLRWTVEVSAGDGCVRMHMATGHVDEAEAALAIARMVIRKQSIPNTVG